MSASIQENVVVAVEESEKKTKSRKPRGGAGDKPVKEKKVKVAKAVPVSKTWNIPNRHSVGLEQTVFLKHIHALIKELAPELLEREDVRDEFNSLVEYLSKYTNRDFVTWDGRRRPRYIICKTMDVHYEKKPYYTFLGGYGSWQDVKNYNSPLKAEIDGRWIKFWELIAPIILVPLRRAYFEKEIRWRIRTLHKSIMTLNMTTDNKIAHIKKSADEKRQEYIKIINKLLKEDPDHTESV
jgi:hypothetical protein